MRICGGYTAHHPGEDCVASQTVRENTSALRLMQTVLKADVRPSTALSQPRTSWPPRGHRDEARWRPALYAILMRQYPTLRSGVIFPHARFPQYCKYHVPGAVRPTIAPETLYGPEVRNVIA